MIYAVFDVSQSVDFRLAFNIIATSSFKHDRLAAEALMALYSSSTSLRALNLRFRRSCQGGYVVEHNG